MSANPTRVDWEAAAPVEPSPLQQGNRVLESIARQEALRALLAFSDLHEQIRNRRTATGCDSDRDLFETERFILDEVLQLISDRAQAITDADGIVIALAEGTSAGRSAATGSTAEGPEMVCRAAAGPLTFARGVPLIGESGFLQDCLESGRILRCDDCEDDARVEMDFARAIGARSTVLVPLGGRNQQIGVLQAFSTSTRGFTDYDVRCLDLFSELVLSALRPADQDRRIHWLSDVASEVLRPKPPVTAPVVADAAIVETEFAVETGLAPSPATLQDPQATVPVPDLAPVVVPEPAVLAQEPMAIPADLVELPELSVADETFEIPPAIDELTPPAQPHVLSFPSQLSLPGSSRAGLRAVMGLVAVAALFSAGAWWGMQYHGKMGVPQSLTTAPAPPVDGVSPEAPDNLMNPAKLASDGAPLAAVAEDKLAALPKVTGVRHWSSSMGSTVVIDMEDNVPYEVHRLMSPERIYFDLHDTVLSPDLEGKTMDVGDASLTRVRVAQPVA